MNVIQKLRAITSRQEKKYLLLLLFLSIIFSIIETIGISAIMPFISMASNPDLITQNETYQAIYTFFGFENSNFFIMAFGFVLIGFYVFRAVYAITYIYLLNRFAFGRYHQFAYRLFQNYVTLPYQEFANRNSAILTKTIITEASNTSALIQQTMMALSEIFTIILLYLLLVIINWKMTLVLTLILGIKSLFLIKAIGKVIKRQGIRRNDLQNRFFRIINESFGNFKIIKLIGNEKKIFNDFELASRGFTRTNIINSTLSQLPRGILETFGFSMLIAVVIYVLYRYNDASFVLPIISMYALALYRMLPAINRLMTSYTNIIFYSKSLDILHEDLTYSTVQEGDEEISFKHAITLNNISFNYAENKPVINNISLCLSKGSRVAFIGESGSGKSTLIDLIIGIYKAENGEIFIDNVKLSDKNVKSWRKKIGYIPQTIYLFDGTIAENVAYGHPLDDTRIIEVLKQANIYSFLQHHEGLQTHVGEGGIKLSGGQKQRIGIARALYSDPEILVLDEATSALDTETEAKIMDELYDIAEGKTLIVIAHRLSTISRCEKIYRLTNGNLSYE